MSPRRARLALVAGLATVLVGSAGALALLPADAAGTTGSSAVTKKGAGEFADLAVTVAKTKGLINEVVQVSWKGGIPSQPPGETRRQFLQIMECWGPDPSGPRPEQCQFGAANATVADPFASEVGARRVRFPPTSGLPVDPAETHPTGPNGSGYIGFEAVDGRRVGGREEDFSVFFDRSGSNEITPAATHGDGTGQEFFEMQTANEAPGLGCGQLVSAPKATPKGRSCWLVVVPRGGIEVDGSRPNDEAAGDPAKRLQTSPLSATNWAARIVFPLEFQPLGGSCPLNSTLTPILGHENATEAITQWQQSLCPATNAVFDYSQLSDDAARGNVLGTDPSLSITAGALPRTPPTGSPVYAPVAVSGFGFAYNLDTKVLPSEPVELRPRAGQRVTDLKLTPRLVAKLLSQSYRQGVTVPESLPESNPRRIEDDPEFKALNPVLNGINSVLSNSIWTIVSPLTPADAVLQVWKWIASDAEARDFLAGKPDPTGMVINLAWKGADLSTPAIPKLDQACRPAFPGQADLCVPDAFPYSNDMHEAVLAATKGDPLGRPCYDQGGPGSPPAFKKCTNQAKGQRGIMVVSDSATAARYNLPMAQLRNANGKFVGPQPANLLANVAKLKPSSTPGVLTPDPAVKDDQAYPLTVISYAVTVPAALTPAARRAYAGFINYAAGPGQKTNGAVGSLPAGYAPMPAALTKTSTATAKAIAGFTPATAPKPTPTPKAKPSGSGAGKPSGGGGNSPPAGVDSSGSGSGAPVPDPGTGAPAPTPAPTTAEPGAEVPTTVPPATADPAAPAVVSFTPAASLGRARLSLLWLVLGGAIAAAGASAVRRMSALNASGPNGLRGPRTKRPTGAQARAAGVRPKPRAGNPPGTPEPPQEVMPAPHPHSPQP